MADLEPVSVLQPIPFFPLIRSLPRWASESDRGSRPQVDRCPMFYLPGVLKRLDAYWLYRAICGKVRAMVARGKADILDAHFGYPDGAGTLMTGQKLGIPTVITVRGVEEDYLQDPELAPLIRRALSDVEHIVCVSHSLRQSLLDAHINHDRISVIHNAVDREMFRPGRRDAARKSLGIDQDTALIVSVGNLLSVKRHDVLIKSIARIAEQHANLQLVIVGGPAHEASHPGELAELARNLGVADRVVFAGRQSPDAVVKWLHAANLFALASRREGCCNAVLEALATGLPVVATRVGDNPWFVRDGVNGFLVESNDVAGMASAISRALAFSDWDGDRIAAELNVGDWSAVGRQVIELLENVKMSGCLKPDRDRGVRG